MLDGIQRPSSPCPDETVLAAYIDGQLSANERADVEDHLAECDDCYDISVETIRLGQESRKRTRGLFTFETIVTIATLLVVLASLVFWIIYSR
jgi:putative zinc finger protein